MQFWQKTTIAFVGLAGMSAAQAGVIYNWQPVSDGPNLETLGGTVEITDAAFASGSVAGEYFVEYSAVPDTFRFPSAAVESVSLQAFTDVENAEQRDFDVSANPTQDQSGNPIFYSLEADLLALDNMLFGSLDLLTNMHEFHMTAGADGLWTVNDFGSDALEFPLGGATGRWVMDASSIDVPAPMAWPLFALGVLGVFGLSRRRAG